jgi:hypothetical protein
MRTKPAISAALLLLLGGSAFAHRTDEYPQATIFSIEADHVNATMRLVPGIAVASAVIAIIDTNGDGVLSEREQRIYAQRVLTDVSLRVDGNVVKPRLVGYQFPSIEMMNEGMGTIQIAFTATLPHGPANRQLSFENHHQRKISAYMVNCLVPSDRNIQILAQDRNREQSSYQLEYVQGEGR